MKLHTSPCAQQTPPQNTSSLAQHSAPSQGAPVVPLLPSLALTGPVVSVADVSVLDVSMLDVPVVLVPVIPVMPVMPVMPVVTHSPSQVVCPCDSLPWVGPLSLSVAPTLVVGGPAVVVGPSPMLVAPLLEPAEPVAEPLSPQPTAAHATTTKPTQLTQDVCIPGHRSGSTGNETARRVDRSSHLTYPAAMRLASFFSLSLLAASGCAHSPTPPPGPRPLGMDSNLVRGDATLAVHFRYEVTTARDVVLLVDLDAGGTGSVGAVELAVVPEGLTLTGAGTWSGELAAGTTQELRFPLHAEADGVTRVTITHAIAGAAASDPVIVRFLIGEETRACQASEEACKMPGDPAPAP